MAESADDTLLPAFGIRELNGPQAPPGIVQVTSTQYDRTIHSQPDAELSYVDDDDGEIITVGSSFELGQRLDEPVKHSTLAAIPALRVPNESNQSGMMHIFDIKHTSASLAEWREHEAYTSKRLHDGGSPYPVTNNTKQGPAASPLLKPVAEWNSSNGSIDPASSQRVPASSTSVVSSLSDAAPTPSGGSTTIDPAPTHGQDMPARVDKLFADMFGGIESKLGPLADFLESTAEGLRKIADKTAKSDHTAVEDVLGGFKDILVQVGGFGLDLAAAIGDGIQKAQDEHQGSLAPPPLPPATSPRSSVLAKPEEPTVSPIAETAGKRVAFVPPPRPQAETKPMQDKPRPRGCYGPNTRDGPPLSEDVNRRSIWEQPSATSAKHSILDMESNDPDFSARYPPLLGLRKAKSVMELQNKAPEAPKENTGPATMRYPTLKEFERDAWAVAVQKYRSKAAASNTDHKGKQVDSYRKPTVEDDVDAEQPLKKVSPGSPEALRKRPSTTLPGTWPGPQSESSTPVLPPTRDISTAKPASASFAENASVLKQGPALSSYPVSPSSSDACPRAPIFPRRNQTVSGTNPAARLNGPFDPLAHIPALKPRPQRSQPDLNTSKMAPSSSLNHKPSLPAFSPNRSRTVNYMDRYIPKYVSPATFSSYAWNHLKNDAKLGREDGHHMPGPGYGVRYFAPYNDRNQSDQVRQEINEQRKGTGPTARKTLPQQYATPSDLSAHSQAPWERPAGRSSHRASTSPGSSTRPRERPNSEVKVAYPNFSAQDSLASLVTTTYPPRPHPEVATEPQLPPISDLLPIPQLAPVPPMPAIPQAPPIPQVPSGPQIPPVPQVASLLHSHPVSARGRSRAPPTPPVSCKAIDECIRTLKDMGFGAQPHEIARLTAVAGAAAGNLEEAIDMLEEDREASEQLQRGIATESEE